MNDSRTWPKRYKDIFFILLRFKWWRQKWPRTANFNAMKEGDTLTYDTRSISTVFKNFFWSLAESLPIKLPNSPDKYNLESVINYYSSFTIADNFCLNKTSENKALKIIKEIEISKAASMNKLSGQFLRDAAEILSRPICEM